MTGHAKSAELLAELRERLGRPPRLGCELTAHRDLGWCQWCPGRPDELVGWRLLAMAERGVPDQPSRS